MHISHFTITTIHEQLQRSTLGQLYWSGYKKKDYVLHIEHQPVTQNNDNMYRAVNGVDSQWQVFPVHICIQIDTTDDKPEQLDG